MQVLDKIEQISICVIKIIISNCKYFYTTYEDSAINSMSQETSFKDGIAVTCYNELFNVKTNREGQDRNCLACEEIITYIGGSV